ncbi:hypothetical protein K435DRAFT_871227 [Dendrothele bispora CBS 962.96]|uniref:Uncharacterized protein n=1 Tax=Dendrothele bispora (strain CBS 962.96) TaxID=1314807 RepID=A0A4S8L5Z5_DENBC|nr:hypothetical protein K435DRAFT_871227 [Dendrothele bispora CBS 962.96]
MYIQYPIDPSIDSSVHLLRIITIRTIALQGVRVDISLVGYHPRFRFGRIIYSPPSFLPSLPSLPLRTLHTSSLNQLLIQQRPSPNSSPVSVITFAVIATIIVVVHAPAHLIQVPVITVAVAVMAATSTIDSFFVIPEHVNVVRGRYDLRVPPSAYLYSGSYHDSNPNSVGVGVGALRTTRSYPPVALDLANVPLSAELDALGRGAGARRCAGIFGGRAGVATRGATRAMNVDEGGRRLDSGRGFDGEEVEGEDGDRGGREKPEELPAYDKYGGPPGYHEHAGGGGGGGMPVIMTVVSDDVGVGDYEALIRRQQQQQQQEMQDGEEGTVQGRMVQDGGSASQEEQEQQEGTVMFTGVGAGGGLGGHWRRRVDGGSGEGAGVVGDSEGSGGADAETEDEDRGGAAEDRTGAEGQSMTGAREEREGRESRE